MYKRQGINYLSGLENINQEEEEEVISKKILELLQKQRSIEAVTGKCNIGPHRDDIEFLINNISIRKYGSSGQQRTFILALKMAELDYYVTLLIYLHFLYWMMFWLSLISLDKIYY